MSKFQSSSVLCILLSLIFLWACLSGYYITDARKEMKKYKIAYEFYKKIVDDKTKVIEVTHSKENYIICDGKLYVVGDDPLYTPYDNNTGEGN